MIRLSKRDVAAQSLTRTGTAACLRLLRCWRGAVALAYHRVGNPENYLFDRELWSTTAEDFEWQIRFAQKHFDVITGTDLHDALKNPAGRYVLFTFDDGYRDNFETAFPILKALGTRATFFVATGFIDQPRVSWFDEIAWMVRKSNRGVLPSGRWLPQTLSLRNDREQAIRSLLRRYKALPAADTQPFVDFLAEETGSGRCDADGRQFWMNWDMLREMQAAGMCIGGHTVNHPVLSALQLEDQRREIETCQQRMAAELGTKMACFSYPIGGRNAFNRFTVEILRELGVPLSFSYYGGYIKPDHLDWYDVPRIAVELETTRPLFQAMLSLPQVFCS